MTTGQFPKPKIPIAPAPVIKPGTVGVISGDLSRYSMFSMCLLNMLSYSGELVSHFDWLTGSNITGNMNELTSRMQGEWLWAIGDDHAFMPDILERLVLHDVDVVAPYCLQRAAPFPQVVYEGEDESADEEGTHILHTNIPQSGLIEVYAVGGAGILVKRHVLEALGKNPWRTSGKQNEDLEFCRRVRAAGFKIHMDTSAILGHIANMIIWPHWIDDKERWGIRMTVGDEQNIIVRRFGPSGSLGAA